MDFSDEQLYDRFLAEGDENDLGALLERHGERLTLFLYGYVHSWEDAEELMLDAFAVTAAGSSPFSGRSSYKTWLFSIGKKLALTFLRKNRIRPERLDDTMAAPGPMPELAALREERNRQLYNALLRLRPEYRQALVLLYFEGMGCEDAGRVMGKTKRQMYHLVERGRQALRETLERMGFDYEGDTGAGSGGFETC